MASALVLAAFGLHAIFHQPAVAGSVGAARAVPIPSQNPRVEATESQDAAMAHAVQPPHPRVQRVSLPRAEKLGKGGKIAIIIDDMGLNARNSAWVVNALPAAVTLSYLPFAPNVQNQVDAARADGHEIMLHLPMEPIARGLHAGPGEITTNLSGTERAARIEKNFSAFTGYRGVNNHMGSRATSTAAVVADVMAAIEDRDVYFIDSWTSPRSVAYQTAAQMDVPRARRDVFLDHDPGAGNVRAMLAQAEYIARRHGAAVVIGHPKGDTIRVLAQWAEGAAARGFNLVPASEVLYEGDIAGDPVMARDSARLTAR